MATPDPLTTPPETVVAPSDLVWLDRILTLTDRVIGLQAELAEARYQRDLAESAADAAPRRRASVYGVGKGAADLVEHAQITADIELRQGLVRQLAEERARADEAERQLQEIRSSLNWGARNAARSAARAARQRWK